MKRILWLPSWYPNKLYPFNGDFIQRHAMAVSLYQPLSVIHLVKDEKGQHTQNVSAETFTENGLHVTIVYYKSFTTGIGVIDKLISSAKYVAVYKKYINAYMRQQGKPAVIHVHVPFKAGILARWYKKKLGIPFIVTEHWCAYNKLNPDSFFNHNAIFRRLVKKIFQSADLVTAVCEANRKELTGIFDIHKSVVIQNVADNRLFYSGQNDVSLPFVFIHVSSLSSQKNVEGILAAFCLLKNNFQNWRCVIIGPHNPLLVAQAKALELEALIEWTGELPYELVALHLRKAHGMVMFSRYENSPCTIIEALMAGVPVIASNVGGIPEIIDAHNGLLVASEDTEGLCCAMAKMIDTYQVYQRKGIAEKATNMFSYEVVGAQMAALYKNFVQPR